jgi:hypothetical protein
MTIAIIVQKLDFLQSEGNKLASMAPTMCSIIDYGPINLPRVYEGTCFGHVFLKHANML